MILQKIIMKILSLLAKLPRNQLIDNLYCKIRYFTTFKRKLNLINPETFNEKIQWLKINTDIRKYHILADKYLVRKYVKEKIGERYLIPQIDKSKSDSIMNPDENLREEINIDPAECSLSMSRLQRNSE